LLLTASQPTHFPKLFWAYWITNKISQRYGNHTDISKLD